ncbi:hypothetical protein HDU78_004658 [Chytriomyces hyalinus]|nr:hypothetical protein HDU78_004658 [Chytriomyces hyalinus]
MTEITTDKNPFAQLVDLTANGNVLFATDDFFQVAETLILKQDPVWDEKKFTPFGKWMDGWETRRKRTEGHDWSIIKLGLSGTISGLHIDTAFFTGNQTPRISIQAACLEKDLALCRRSEMGSCATNEETKAADSIQTHLWEEILPMVALRPGYPGERHHYFGVTSAKRWTHLRINYFPDGGVARLRAYGTVVKDWSRTSKTDLVDLIALENGGTPVSSSNSHYGTPFNLISKPESEGMYDGWETARNPKRPPVFQKGKDGLLIIPGAEWVIFRVGVPDGGFAKSVMVDTAFFRGNYPESILVEACQNPGKASLEGAVWTPLVPRTRVKADIKHEFIVHPSIQQRCITHVRLTVFPDGGVARLRVYGTVVASSLSNL